MSDPSEIVGPPPMSKAEPPAPAVAPDPAPPTPTSQPAVEAVAPIAAAAPAPVTKTAAKASKPPRVKRQFSVRRLLKSAGVRVYAVALVVLIGVAGYCAFSYLIRLVFNPPGA